MSSPRQAPYADFEQSLRRLAERLTRTLARIEELRGSGDETGRQALAFNLERAAWTSIELADAWVFEKRLGLPKKETESFDLLMREGLLAPAIARPLRQACEYRALSRRPDDRIDWDHAETEAAVAAFRAWLDLLPTLG